MAHCVGICFTYTIVGLEQFEISIGFKDNYTYAPNVNFLGIALGVFDLRSHVVFASTVGFGSIRIKVDNTSHPKIYKTSSYLTLACYIGGLLLF